MALHHNHSIGRRILDGHRCTGQNGQLLGTEGIRFITDPLINISLRLHLFNAANRNRCHKTVFSEVRINIKLPVNNLHQIINIMHTVLRGVLPEQLLRHNRITGQRLIHGKHIRGFLRLIGAERARCVQHPRRHIPAGTRLKPVGLRNIGNLVITLRKVNQTLTHIIFGCPGGKAEKGIGKIRTVVVNLRRKIIGLGFTLLSGQCGMFITMMNMMRQRPLVIKEFGVHRPALMRTPDTLAKQRPFQLFNRFAQQNLLCGRAILKNNLTQTLAFTGQRTIVSRGG